VLQTSLQMTVQGLTRRPASYVLEDGVTELVMGCFFAINNGAWLVQQSQPPGSDGTKGYLWAAQAVGIGAALGAIWAMRTLKSRVVYPRGGFVALEDSPKIGAVPRRWLALLGIWLIALAAGVWIWRRPPDLTRINALAAVWPFFVAIIYAVGGIRYRLTYMFRVSAGSLAISAWFFAYSTGWQEGFRAMLFESVFLAIVGAFRLWRFVKTHPKPVEDEA
jgi:hypothetical protein